MTAKTFQASLQSDSTEVQDPFFLHTDKALTYEDKSPTQGTLLSKRNESLFSPPPWTNCIDRYQLTHYIFNEL